MSNHSGDKHRQHVTGLILLIAAVAVMAAVLILLGGSEDPEAGTRGATAADLGAPLTDSDPADIGTADTVVWNGVRYRKRPNLQVVLLIGYDKNGETSYGNRQGGMSDFLVLAVQDDNAETVSLLQIDRDSMTRIPTYDSFGRPGGSKVMQICFSHYWTGSIDQNDLNTKEAVENMLGIRVDDTVSMDFSGIIGINRLVGGVTVTVRDDMTNVDEAFVRGAEVTLTDSLVIPFVRARMNVGDGSNAGRMARQRDYMNAYVAKAEAMAKADAGFVTDLVNGFYDVANFSRPKGWMINEMNKIYQNDYRISQPVTLGGTSVPGSQSRSGYREFYIDQDELIGWVLSTLYRPMD